MVRDINISNHIIGSNNPCFIISEVGVNHNGDLHLAKELIEASVEAGADAVKFQSFKTDNLATKDAPKAEYQTKLTDTHESQYEMLCRLELSSEMHWELSAHCQRREIVFLSSTFDEDSADLLSEIDVPAFKIPSGEITNIPLLKHVARKNRPMIVSTGMAYLREIETAVHVIESQNNKEIVLLQCTSNYPADPSDANLAASTTTSAAFNAPVGFSDHTTGITVALAAVALGACVVEKHFTLDRTLPGPDQNASLEPGEFTELVKGIRTVESAIGDGRKIPSDSEADTASVARKSIVASYDISPGTVLTPELLAVKRPGTGISPELVTHVLGRTTNQPIAEGTILRLDMLL